MEYKYEPTGMIGNWTNSALNNVGNVLDGTANYIIPSNTGVSTAGNSNSGGWSSWEAKLTDPNWWFSPMGSGDNAVTPAQLGITGGLGLLGIMNQRKQFGAQLEQARKQFEFSKGLSQANFATQGTNFLNQGLFQLEGLKAFNPNAGAERAQNLNAAVNKLNAAGSRIGMGNNTFQDQQNAISKYNQLQGR